MFRPVGSQQVDDPRVIKTNRRLQDNQKLRRKTGPAFPQNEIVGVFNAQACYSAKYVNWREQFLDIEQFDLPGIRLRGQPVLQSVGCCPMPTAGVMEDDGQLAQGSPGMESGVLVIEVLR